MRKKIVAGNWKMNKDSIDSENLILDILKIYVESQTEMIIAPPFTNLSNAVKILKSSSIKIAAQNIHYADSGAYTGEISAKMLQSIGVENVIIGHSERRTYFNETNELIAKKVKSALENNMRVIFCFGEKIDDRSSGNQNIVVKKQITDALFNISESYWSNIVLAYEPVWAIGTGETASPQQAQEMHAYVRELIAENYSNSLSESVSILYGGSIKPNNARDIFSNKDVDGGLIGGASLNANDFIDIFNAC